MENDINKIENTLKEIMEKLTESPNKDYFEFLKTFFNEKVSEKIDNSSKNDNLFTINELSNILGFNCKNWMHKNNHRIINELHKLQLNVIRGRNNEYLYPREVINIIKEMKKVNI